VGHVHKFWRSCDHFFVSYGALLVSTLCSTAVTLTFDILTPNWDTTWHGQTLQKLWAFIPFSPTLSTKAFTVGAGKGGAKGACAPAGTVQGAAFGGTKIWNYEMWTLLANWCLHCRQWYFTPLIRPNTPSFGTTPPTVRLYTGAQSRAPEWPNVKK